jgi:hypothetical protein
MWQLSLQFIKGFMVGMEYVEEEDLFFVMLDLGFIRLMYVRATAEEE